MTRLEQMIVAVVHGFFWVTVHALTEPQAMGHSSFAIYTMGLILLYVLPAPAMAWKLRKGLDSKEWARIAVRGWLASAFIIAVLCRIGFPGFIQERLRSASLDMCIFAGLIVVPLILAFVFWVTRGNQPRASYPIRGARRKFGTNISNPVPFSGETGTRL